MSTEQREEYFFTLRDLTVGYDGRVLIRDISLGLKKGQILTLIGPNGGGKSTVLKSIAGQLALLDGCVMLAGQDMATMSAGQVARQMAVLLTGGMQAAHMSCREVVAMGRYPYTGHFGLLTDGDQDIIEEAMKLADITDISERRYGQISDGQKQRVLLARAFCQEPSILVLDEPTSFLDIRYKLEFFNALTLMQQKRQLTIVLSLHELEPARRISDYILCVQGEYVKAYGRPEEIFAHDTIRTLFGMSEQEYEKAAFLGLIAPEDRQ